MGQTDSGEREMSASDATLIGENTLSEHRDNGRMEKMPAGKQTVNPFFSSFLCLPEQLLPRSRFWRGVEKKTKSSHVKKSTMCMRVDSSEKGRQRQVTSTGKKQPQHIAQHIHIQQEPDLGPSLS